MCLEEGRKEECEALNELFTAINFLVELLDRLRVNNVCEIRDEVVKHFLNPPMVLSIHILGLDSSNFREALQ